MIPLLYAIVFVLALLGGFFGALAGYYVTARMFEAKVDQFFPPEKPRLHAVKPQKPSKREENEWKDAPGPISPSQQKREKAKIPIPEED